MMKRLRKVVCSVLSVCIVLSLFIGVNVSAKTTYTDITEIGEIMPNKKMGISLNYPGYNGDEYFSINYPNILTDEDIEFLLEIFSDENLVYNCFGGAEIVPSKERPGTGNFHLLEDGERGNNWTFYFDEEQVYIISIRTDFNANTDNYFSHAWFTYRSESVYKKLIDFVNQLAEKQFQSNNDKMQESLKDQILISDINEVYYAYCPLGNFAEGFHWGICEYTKNGKCITVPYWAYADPYELEIKQYYIADTKVKNNTVYFDMDKAIVSYDRGETGREYDSDEEMWLCDYEMQANVSESGKVTDITIAYTYEESGRKETEIVDMSKYVQHGTLPSSGECAFLPENNMDYSNVDNEVRSNLETSVDIEKKNDTVAETSETKGNKEETIKEEITTKDESKEDESDVKEETQTQQEISELNKENERETVQEKPEIEAEEISNSEEDTDASENEGVLQSASAMYTDYADSLNRLGLFRGTEKGYELEGNFTRDQGAAMIVRLLGEESDVLKEEATGIFADVPADNWAAPYVKYCYTNGITKGTGRNNYSPNETMSGAQYVTLVLRALGYTYAEPETAEKLSVERGLLPSAMAWEIIRDPQLSRDRMVYVSYQALTTKMHSGKTLIEDLTDRGVVDETVAMMLELIE